MFRSRIQRREIYVGLPTVIAIIGNKLFPRLGDLYLGKNGVKSQLTQENAEPNAPDNLYEPVGGDPGAHGRFDQRAHPHSPQLGAICIELDRRRVVCHGGGVVRRVVRKRAGLGFRFFVEPPPSARDEDIFERRLCQRNRVDFTRELPSRVAMKAAPSGCSIRTSSFSMLTSTPNECGDLVRLTTSRLCVRALNYLAADFLARSASGVCSVPRFYPGR